VLDLDREGIAGAGLEGWQNFRHDLQQVCIGAPSSAAARATMGA